jgi:hypothetical protein
MNTKVMIIIAIILIIMICFMYYYYLGPSTTVAHFTSSPGGGLVCNSPAAISAAKNYYDKIGEYNGVFVLDPISSVQVDPTTCDVKYRYIPTPTSPRNDSEVDSRRFIYRYGSEGWSVVNMLDFESGVMNPGGISYRS